MTSCPTTRSFTSLMDQPERVVLKDAPNMLYGVLDPNSHLSTFTRNIRIRMTVMEKGGATWTGRSVSKSSKEKTFRTQNQVPDNGRMRP